MNELVRTNQMLRPTLGRNFSHMLQDGLRGLLRSIDGYLERRRQRLALLALSDHMLKDIGLTRAQAVQEGSKPFWQV